MSDFPFCAVSRAPDRQQSFEAAVAENPLNDPNSGSGSATRKKRGAGDHSYLWSPGRTLCIYFITHVDTETQQAILGAASEWLEYANLKFELVDNWREADIKIESGVQPYEWSCVGTDALLNNNEATMGLNVRHDTPDLKQRVLHEFGHALGMQHEHQHPDADITWNEKSLRGIGWSDSAIADNFLAVIPKGPGMLITPYDRQSIMHYAIPREFSEQDLGDTGGTSLSEGDKAWARLAYPAFAVAE
ncbi:M12 family metallopeptidase [Pseudomonas sp. RIT-To-2]|uniref:M12 family metallopeptidase n=1 Tax=Pseudomonas sp. RIT-To-2 TaxID=3462541 RepID=UPI002413C8D1